MAGRVCVVWHSGWGVCPRGVGLVQGACIYIPLPTVGIGPTQICHTAEGSDSFPFSMVTWNRICRYGSLGWWRRTFRPLGTHSHVSMEISTFMRILGPIYSHVWWIHEPTSHLLTQQRKWSGDFARVRGPSTSSSFCTPPVTCLGRPGPGTWHQGWWPWNKRGGNLPDQNDIKWVGTLRVFHRVTCCHLGWSCAFCDSPLIKFHQGVISCLLLTLEGEWDRWVWCLIPPTTSLWWIWMSHPTL